MSPTTEWADFPERATPAEEPTGRFTVAVVGLGEVGRVYGTALHAAGHHVRGFDPYAPGPVDGVEVTATLEEAVTDADVVLTLTAATASLTVAEEVVGHIAQGAAYVDCTSSAPNAKRAVVDVFAARPDVAVADVAILGPVIQLGVETPLMAAGPAAETAAQLMRPLGAGVAVVDGQVGDAMAHKLLRSVFMKGLAAAVTEAVTAGRAVGFEDWIRGQIARELSGDGQRTIDRFLRGSVVHARRRADEMEAAAAYLADLGVDATMSTATAEHLHGLEQQ
jgi:3-hydroxyisobutyrate dehydrogenase